MSRRQEVKEAALRKPVFVLAITRLEEAFRQIESQAPPPSEIYMGEVPRFRFTGRQIEAAIFLKFAALNSLVQTLEMLVEGGRIIEQGIIQRVIEELNEDIMFLCLGLTEKNITELHSKFLEAFWMEDYEDPADPVKTRNKRPFSRRGIGPFINRALGQPDPSTADHAGRSIYEMYSGFLHGAAPHIMEIFDENRMVFRFDGILGSVRHVDYIFDAQNSIYRALLSGACVAKALGLPDTLAYLQVAIDDFVSSIGREKLEATPK